MTRRPGLRAGARRVLAVGALTAVVSVVGVGPAAAHDALVGSDPADGSTEVGVPTRLVLRFEEPPVRLGIAVAVLGPGGDVVVGTPVLVGSSVTVALRPGSPAGAYRVSWRVTSDDGHPVQGTTRFTARTASAAAPSSTAPSSTAPSSTAPSSTAPSSTAPSSPAPPSAAPSAAPVAAATSPASGRGTAVAVVLGLVVLVALAAVIVGRRRAR